MKPEKVDDASLKLARVPDSFHQKAEAEIDRIRKVNLSVVTNYNQPVVVHIEQQTHAFPIGSAIDAKLFLANDKYRNFFYENFNYAVFENRMKWRQIEWNSGNRTNFEHFDLLSGQRKFDEVDQVMDMLEQKNIPVRGHAVFWAVDQYVPAWLSKLSENQQLERCKGQVRTSFKCLVLPA